MQFEEFVLPDAATSHDRISIFRGMWQPLENEVELTFYTWYFPKPPKWLVKCFFSGGSSSKKKFRWWKSFLHGSNCVHPRSSIESFVCALDVSSQKRVKNSPEIHGIAQSGWLDNRHVMAEKLMSILAWVDLYNTLDIFLDISLWF